MEDLTNEEEKQKSGFGIFKKIENILDNDRLIKIYALLPDKESKKEFLGTVLESYTDRLAEKFDERLESEFEPDDVEIKKSYLKENAEDIKTTQDVLRSRRREPVNKGVTERINFLVTQLQQGNYISKGDREFLARNLARSANVYGTTPSSRRDEIRSIIDNYMKARNLEAENDANAYADRQVLIGDIQSLKVRLKEEIKRLSAPVTPNEANGIHIGDDKDADPYTRVMERRRRTIQNIKEQIAQLEELLESENQKKPLDSMLNNFNGDFDVNKNNDELEILMEILDKEQEKIKQDGVKLPETGIVDEDASYVDFDFSEEEKVEGSETHDVEKLVETDSLNVEPQIQSISSEAISKDSSSSKENVIPNFVVNVEATMEQKYEQNNDVLVVEPMLGTRLEDFANAIMEAKTESKPILSRFNNFDINTNDYQSPEEIVAAYDKFCEESKKKGKKISDNNQNITPSEIESVIAIDPRTLQIMSEISATKQLVRTEQKDVTKTIEEPEDNER